MFKARFLKRAGLLCFYRVAPEIVYLILSAYVEKAASYYRITSRCFYSGCGVPCDRF